MNKQRRVIPALAIIFNEQGQILLTKRDEPESPYHGLWEFPGGGIEHGENPQDTVLREVKEETGLTVQLLTKHPFVYSHLDERGEVHTIVMGFPARYVSGKIDTNNEPDVSEARWFNYEKIDFARTIPLTKEMLEEAREYMELNKKHVHTTTKE